MSVTLPIASGSYPYSENGESNWGQQNADAMVAVCANALWGSGGVVTYLTSATANPASAGMYRLAHTDSIAWRNVLNTNNLLLKPNASTDVLEFNGKALAEAEDFIPLVTPVTTGNIAKQKADGSLEDGGIAASTLSVQGYPYANPGKIDVFGDYTAPAASFPYYWLGNDDAIITTTNWPDLVPTLRAKYLKDGGTAQAKVWLTNAVVAGDGASATLTYTAFATAIKGPMSARTATKLLHGLTKYPYAVAPKMTLTIPTGGANNVPAGTYYISAITTTEATRTIVVATTGLTAGGSSAIDIGAEVYPHRVADTVASPTTKAWVYKADEGNGIQYVAGNTYNGVLLAVTGDNSWTTYDGIFIPRKTNTGQILLNGRINGGGSSVSTFSLTVDGISIVAPTSPAPGWDISVGGSGTQAYYGITTGSNTMQLYSFASADAKRDVSIVDLPLGSLPTWANSDELPWAENNQRGQYTYIWGKTYTP